MKFVTLERSFIFKKIVKDFQISEVIHSDASSMFNLIDKAIKDKLYFSAEKLVQIIYPAKIIGRR